MAFNQRQEEEKLKEDLKSNDYNEMNRVYVMKCRNFYKIGISGNPFQRLTNLQRENPFSIKLVIYKKFKNASEVERLLHRLFRNKNTKREWFNLQKRDIKTLVKIFEKGYVSEDYFINWAKRKKEEREREKKTSNVLNEWEKNPKGWKTGAREWLLWLFESF